MPIGRIVSNEELISGGVTIGAGGRLRHEGNAVLTTNTLYRCASGHQACRQPAARRNPLANPQ